MKHYRADEFIDEGCVIYAFLSPRRTRTERPHTHDFYELVYCLSGSAEHYIDESRYVLGRGDMLFICPGSSHFFETENKQCKEGLPLRNCE